ncbi:Vitamin B6 photo-protection and homoeostasis [Popillia japonica]|uniref:Vitamin B6 photo-protection and homoeostasis n=1 Tax=Popillia japonica TaxID=7064 RepID=A0AAW1HW33_POPJA
MSQSRTILIREQCGSLGSLVSYSKEKGSRYLVRLAESTTLASSFLTKIQDVFRDIFLPHGYPDSVSEDYLNYQIWDTIQAFCSTITGTFTTEAILKGVGVGDAQASPLAAAITWIIKDGTGMIGRIIFAWWKGSSLDSDCKKWRMFADITNDAAMFLELTVPYFPEASLYILCLTTTMKAVVGVAGGATRASITQHQAIKGNMADISAKDGSQETCVNLIASIFGIILLAVFEKGEYTWTIFMIFATIHILANYMAVQSLIFRHLNSARLLLLIKMYLKFDTVISPININKRESVFLGFGIRSQDLCGYKIKIGCSLRNVVESLSPEDLEQILESHSGKNYIIVPDFKRKSLYVALKTNDAALDVISAYFDAVLTGIALSKYNNQHMDLNLKRHLHQVTPLIRLSTVVKTFPKNTTGKPRNLPKECMSEFNDYINFELANFFIAMKVNGWNVQTHALQVGSWRYLSLDNTTPAQNSTKKEK